MPLEAPYYFAGHELESPLVSAAGSINGRSLERIRQEYKELLASSIGGITLGSFTLPENIGNEEKFGEPVFYHSLETKESFNSIGLDNIGSDAAVGLADEFTEMAHERGKMLIYSGSPLGDPSLGTSVEQAVQLAQRFLETKVDLVEINASCPNIVIEGGGRKPIMSYDLDTMDELVEEIYYEIGVTERLGLKISPFLNETESPMVPDLAKILRGRKVFRFLVTCNTIPNMVPLGEEGRPIFDHLPGNKVGMSGGSERVKKIAREQLVYWADELQNDDIDINSSTGVNSGSELLWRENNGASVGSGVSFLWRPDYPGMKATWGDRITKMHLERAEASEAYQPGATT